MFCCTFTWTLFEWIHYLWIALSLQPLCYLMWLQNIFTATEDAALSFYFSSVIFLLISILYSMQKNVYIFSPIPLLSFPDIWPKKTGDFKWTEHPIVQHESLWLHKKAVNKLIRFGFQPPHISSPALHTKQTLESDLFLQCSECASAGFGTENWQCKSLYFISSVFTVTMTALIFRKNSHWLALPFVLLLLGTNRHDCNQTFFWIHAL